MLISLSRTNYSNTLIGWANLASTPQNITFGAQGLVYDASAFTARNTLVNSDTWTIVDSGHCVHETTDFLCFCPITNTKKYINIKEIKEGYLVQTYNDNYVGVKSIVKNSCFNSKEPIKYKFYVMKKEQRDILTHDLLITGKHCLLYDTITEKQHKKMRATGIEQLKVYGKHKLCSIYDYAFEGKTDETIEDVYTMVLESDDHDKVFGVYVNGGVLIETCSINACKSLGLIE